MRRFLLPFLLLAAPVLSASAAVEELDVSESSSLAYASYEPAAGTDWGTLTVRFRGDATPIRYFEVPRGTWEEFRASDSFGAFYAKNIRLQFERQYGKSRSEVFDSPLPLSTLVNVRCGFNEECEPLVLEGIAKARESIYVAAYAFTRAAIARALIDAHRRGVFVAIKMDERQSHTPQAKRVLAWIREEGIPIQFIYVTGEYSAMHNKFLVIDARWVLAGSFNFTTTAQVSNWENILFLDSDEVASQYRAAWEGIVSDDFPPEKTGKKKHAHKEAAK
jgi:phosphatidylserine/phosphatidylglycerophosphate/cardiolipin synthase-like enzyme